MCIQTREGPSNKVKFSSIQKEVRQTAMGMPGREHLAEGTASAKALGQGQVQQDLGCKKLIESKGPAAGGKGVLGADESCACWGVLPPVPSGALLMPCLLTHPSP